VRHPGGMMETCTTRAGMAGPYLPKSKKHAGNIAVHLNLLKGRQQ
jgi:hypothetical protein